MNLQFYKYQGTGNDFVIIDNRKGIFKNNTKVIRQLCDRKFGIGADGLILLEEEKGADFKMTYYNADGNESSMCGNGGRCIVSFAKKLKIIDQVCRFTAIDGQHEASIDASGMVELKMQNTLLPKAKHEGWFVDTGSPHFVLFTKDVSAENVYEKGRQIRYDYFGAAGANVNFVEWIDNNNIRVRTYERGVEDETLSCGTGVVAAVLCMHNAHKLTGNDIGVKTIGGELRVRFKKTASGYQQIWLCGPATIVFEGKIPL